MIAITSCKKNYLQVLKNSVVLSKINDKLNFSYFSRSQVTMCVPWQCVILVVMEILR